MAQIELSYEELRQEIMDEIKKYSNGFLATSDKESVTVRQIVLVRDGLTIYCFTNLNSRKYKQLMANPNVAIAAGNLQIEGKAKLKGHPLDDDNSRFIELLREQHPQTYEIGTTIGFTRPFPRVIEINPTKVSKWIRGGQIDILNVTTKQAHKVEWTELEESPAYNN